MTSIGRSGSDEPSGCQPSASAADASSRSGIPNAELVCIDLVDGMGYTNDLGSYVSFGLWLEGRTQHFKLSRGGAEVLAAEITGLLAPKGGQQ